MLQKKRAMETDNIYIHGQGNVVKVLGGKVNVGPHIIVDGDINALHETRNLICFECSKQVQ